MITESPCPIKDHSELVFSSLPCKILSPHVSLSEHFRQGTGLFNVLIYDVIITPAYEIQHSYLKPIITRPPHLSSQNLNFYRSLVAVQLHFTVPLNAHGSMVHSPDGTADCSVPQFSCPFSILTASMLLSSSPSMPYSCPS